jgi:hypothetical protein
MVATTYDGARVAGLAGAKISGKIAGKPAKKGRGFFTRLLDAFITAQMKRAERELALHRHLLPDDFEFQGRLRRDDQVPFGGW